MSQDIARYIEIVGKDNLKRHLKENLKAELHRAIQQENWQLAQEISRLIENIEKCELVSENLIKCVELIGISKINSDLKDDITIAIDSEDWHTVKELAEIFSHDSNHANEYDTQKVKTELKNILNELIVKEDWYLAKKIADIIKTNFNTIEEKHPDWSYTKARLKNILKLSVRANKYYLLLEINAKIEETENKLKTIRNQLEVNVWQRLSKIIAEQLEIEEEQVKPENVIEKYDYGFFGYPGEEFFELMLATEEEFDIEICDEIAKQIDTVGKLYNFVICNLE